MTRHIIQKTDTSEDGRRTAPAASRNLVPLIEALGVWLPPTGHILEVASGTGQHAAAFAEAFPGLVWTPSDVDPGQRESIAAWQRAARLLNLSKPLAVDVAAPWPVTPGSMQAVLTINLFHLIPNGLVTRFFEEALTTLSDGGRVMVYGPFRRGTRFASEGDQHFDASLRARDPAIGYKSVEEVSEIAETAGFKPVARDDMPANNLLLTFAAA